jgi:hypothetical protein
LFDDSLKLLDQIVTNNPWSRAEFSVFGQQPLQVTVSIFTWMKSRMKKLAMSCFLRQQMQNRRASQTTASPISLRALNSQRSTARPSTDVTPTS